MVSSLDSLLTSNYQLIHSSSSYWDHFNHFQLCHSHDLDLIILSKPLFFSRSTYQSVDFQSVKHPFNGKYPDVDHLKRPFWSRGRLEKILQTLGLYQRRHVQLFPQRQSELVWSAVTTLIAFNVPRYDKTNKELTMTRRWNQITRCWRHFLCCCSHRCESCCRWWCCSQITFIFAIYRTRSTLRYCWNDLDYVIIYDS